MFMAYFDALLSEVVYPEQAVKEWIGSLVDTAAGERSRNQSHQHMTNFFKQ